MYELVGIRHDYTPNSYTGQVDEETIEKVVATFDTKEQAEDYVAKSRLKQPKGSIWASRLNFKCVSLLGNYSYTEIRAYEPDLSPPHNPAPPSS